MSFFSTLIRNRLLERLELIPINPSFILDLHTSSANCLNELHTIYPLAKILPVPIGELLKTPSLPIKEKAVKLDLVFSNLALSSLQDIETLKQVFKGVLHLLKPNGLFLFSCYGPDTFIEITPRVLPPSFLELHHLGDQLLQVSFNKIVMDRELLTIDYTDSQSLWEDLQAAKGSCQKPPADLASLTVEVIYGQASAPSTVSKTHGTHAIPIRSLKG